MALTPAQKWYLDQIDRQMPGRIGRKGLMRVAGPKLKKTVPEVFERIARLYKVDTKTGGFARALQRVRNGSTGIVLLSKIRKWTPTLIAHMTETAKAYIQSTAKPTKTGIRRALIVSILRWKETQLPTVLTTDMHVFQNLIMKYLIPLTGADRKMWVTQRDSRVRKTHRKLDGQIVPAKGFFRIPGTNLRAQRPGSFGRPEEDINCRCQSVPYPLPGDLPSKAALWRTIDRYLKSIEIDYRRGILRYLKSRVNRIIKAIETYKSPLGGLDDDGSPPGFKDRETLISNHMDELNEGRQIDIKAFSKEQQENVAAITMYTNGPVAVMVDPSEFKGKGTHVENSNILVGMDPWYKARMMNREDAERYSRIVKRFASDPMTGTKRELIRSRRRFYDGHLYRGVALSSVAANGLRAGQTFTMRDISSWSLKRSVSESFASSNANRGDFRVVFRENLNTVKTGSYISPFSHFRNEEEVIRSGEIRIKAVHENTDPNVRADLIIDVEQV